MAVMERVKRKDILMGNLPHGCDLLGEITAICQREDIRVGRIEALGAVQTAQVAYYNQESKEYEFHTLDQAMEITKLVGNVSIKDGDPFVHAHITLADESGKAFGGHLAPGTIVFACEFVLESFDGPVFERELDAQTGLPLW